MPFPIPHFPSGQATESPATVALVRTVTREDVAWHRPIFRAPPLELGPEAFDVTRFAQELRRIGLVGR
jgi:hypothetical protein